MHLIKYNRGAQLKLSSPQEAEQGQEARPRFTAERAAGRRGNRSRGTVGGRGSSRLAEPTPAGTGARGLDRPDLFTGSAGGVPRGAGRRCLATAVLVLTPCQVRPRRCGAENAGSRTGTPHQRQDTGRSAGGPGRDHRTTGEEHRGMMSRAHGRTKANKMVSQSCPSRHCLLYRSPFDVS